MSIIISAESTIDLPKEMLAEFKIRTVPFTLVMGEVTEHDGEVLGDDLFAYTEKTGKLAKTTAVNRDEFEKYFNELLKEADEVIHFSLSSEMSSAYNNACSVAATLGGKVHVIDSRVLSTGIALEAIYASKLNQAGYSADEIVEMVKARIPYDQTSFGLESVEYLYKGGRCSSVKNFVVSKLGLKPRILVENGKMAASKIFRGSMKRWVRKYAESILEQFNNPDHELVFITYSSCEDQEILDDTYNLLKENGFKDIRFTRSGGTVSCHCGPHCLGVLYMNDGDHPVEPKK